MNVELVSCAIDTDPVRVDTIFNRGWTQRGYRSGLIGLRELSDLQPERTSLA